MIRLQACMLAFNNQQISCTGGVYTTGIAPLDRYSLSLLLSLVQVAANCSSGVVDARQRCCPSGLLDNSSMCCEESSSLDRAGRCCPGGTLDACGVCDGAGKAIDVEGTCCNANLDAAGACCLVRSYQPLLVQLKCW